MKSHRVIFLAALAAVSSPVAAWGPKDEAPEPVPVAPPTVVVPEPAPAQPITATAGAEADSSAAAAAEAAANVNAAANVFGGSTSLRSIGLANGAPIPPACPPGLVPGAKGKRGFHFSLGAMSAICVAPDEDQRKAIQEQRAHELALLELQLKITAQELERDRRIEQAVGK